MPFPAQRQRRSVAESDPACSCASTSSAVVLDRRWTPEVLGRHPHQTQVPKGPCCLPCRTVDGRGAFDGGLATSVQGPRVVARGPRGADAGGRGRRPDDLDGRTGQESLPKGDAFGRLDAGWFLPRRSPRKRRTVGASNEES